MIAKSVTELIGNTPIVQLNRLPFPESADVFLKLEYINPGRSVKDRTAYSMIEEAEKQGLLRSGSTIIEPTSGNTGIGLAMIAAAKGYRTIIIMPASANMERIKLVKAYGAEVVLTPADRMMQGCIEKAKALHKEIPGSFIANQFMNKANPAIHKKTTALEILEQTDGSLDAFVATAGTGGTISGVGGVLKKHIPGIKIIVVESKSSPVIAGGRPGAHKLIGTGPGFIPNTLNMKIFDSIFHVTDEEAIETTRNLAKMEGILCGISSGAAVFAALQIAKELGPGKRVLTIAPDTGERYISMNLI
jgi:cysteine synthase